MNKTLQTAFLLKSTYRVNSIIYSLKQLPLLGRIFPDELYRVRGLKVLARVIFFLWEIIMTFAGKWLYFLIMVEAPITVYGAQNREQTFLHIFIFLSVTGSFINSFLFNPTKDKYYAMILLRVNPRNYTLISYGYEILKVLLGFGIFGIWFGLKNGLPPWQSVLIPLFVVGLKLIAAAYYLENYEGTGTVTDENKINRTKEFVLLLLLAVAYGAPVLGIALPVVVSQIFMIVCIVIGVFCGEKVITFRYYREIYREMFAQMGNRMDVLDGAAVVQKEINRKLISGDKGINSNRKGFEYLNELFVKRHQQILWQSTLKITFVCSGLLVAALLGLAWKQEGKALVNELIITFLPFFTIVMYAMNRGAGFTRALFVNCDHSLLTYSFYKESRYILELYQIRLRGMIKINLLPAVVLGAGLALLLWASGGAQSPMYYLIIILSICCLSIFFSVHHLTIYYLLQPYNAETEIRSATYRLVDTATYLLCYFIMGVKIPTLYFGVMMLMLCVGYCIVSCVLVYCLAPRTFRIRG